MQAAIDDLNSKMAGVAKLADAWAAKHPESWWAKHGGAELEPLAHVLALVDAKWLLSFAKGEAMPERKGIVPALQQRPEASFVSIEKLRDGADFRGLPLGIISYGWAAKLQCALASSVPLMLSPPYLSLTLGMLLLDRCLACAAPTPPASSWPRWCPFWR